MTTFNLEQNNLIARLLDLGRKNKITTEVVFKANVFPATHGHVLSNIDRQRYWTVLAQAQQFHGAHRYRDSEDEYERELWSERNTRLANAMDLVNSTHGCAELRATLIDTQCLLSDILKVNEHDEHLKCAVMKLSKAVQQEIASLYA